MASADLVRTEEDGDDAGLNPRQVEALEKLVELDAEPAEWDEEAGKWAYHKNPQIRAYQMIFQGRFGGPGRGQGRKREPRAAEVIAEALRENKRVKKMIRAIDAALDAESERTQLDAIKLSMEIERGERSLQLKEEAHEDHLGNTKEELLGTIFELVTQPGVESAIEGEAEEVTEAEVIEDDTLDRQGEEPEAEGYDYDDESYSGRTSSASTNGHHRDSSSSEEAGDHGGIDRKSVV